MDFLSATTDTFRSNKRIADRAIEQVSDEKLRISLDQNTNSIAVIMKHVSGNLLSRWSDFLTSDGEKGWRDRDDEFVDRFHDRAEVIAHWEKGWACLFDSLGKLQTSDLEKSVLIRGESHTVPLAIERSLGHTCYHIGQIVLIARIHAGTQWNMLTIPKGGSREFNEATWGKGMSRG